jgi:O-antigen ligase
VQAFFIYYCVHIVWLLGTQDFDQAGKVLHEAKFLLYPLLFISFIDKRYLPRMFGAFLLGMMLSELWSYGIFFEWLPPNYHDGNQGGPSDPTPVYHHTHYGFMLATTLTLVLQRLIYDADNYRLKAVLGFFFITASVNLFITAGRTGYVLYLVMLFVLFFLVFKKRVWLASAVTLSVCGIAFSLAFNFSTTFHDRVLTTVKSVQSIVEKQDYRSSLGARVAVLSNSVGVVKDNFWFGVGTGDHLDAVRAKIAKTAPNYSHVANAFQHLHNEYFSALIQFGIVGLLAFLYIIFQLIRYPHQDAAIKNMQIILAVGIAAFSVIDVFLLGLGALLVTITLTSFSFKRFIVESADYGHITKIGVIKYFCAVVLIELVSWVT